METREAYRQKLNARMEAWDAEIQKLESQAKEADADARLELQKRIKEIRAKYDEARERVEGLSEVGEDAWADFKADLDKAVNDLEARIKSAVSS